MATPVDEQKRRRYCGHTKGHFGYGHDPVVDAIAAAEVDGLAVGWKTELSWFDGRVFDDASSCLLYSQDQSRAPAAVRKLLTAMPLFVAQPASIDACSRLVAYLAERGIPIIPRGAASYGLGGVVPTCPAGVIDFSHCRRVLAVDPAALKLTAESGCRWSDLSEILEPYGLDIITYPTSIFSTIAGWVATGGAGIGTLKYGHLRELVEALRVIRPDGSITDLAGDNSELASYFGSEGQLGLIWSVTLRVRERHRVFLPVLLAVDADAAASAIAPIACRHGAYALSILNRNRTRAADSGPGLLPDSDCVLAVFERQEEAAGFAAETRAIGLRTEARGAASYLWNERFFPIRAKKLAPGMLAADLLMPRRALPAIFRYSESAGRRFGVSVSVEASFDTPESAVTLPSFLSSTPDATRYAIHGFLAMSIAREGIARGGRPYGFGLWYSAFRSKRPNARELRRLKRRLDATCVLNPGKDLSPGPRSRAWSAIMRAALALRGPLLPLVALLGRALPSERAVAAASGTALARAIDACSSCGSCLAKCPAYVETADERTTARGKLAMAEAILRSGASFGATEEQTPHLCMHCKFCTQVCQSDIPLEDVFAELEALLAARSGLPEREIAAFVQSIESKGLLRALGLSSPAAQASASAPLPRRNSNRSPASAR